MVNTNFIKNFLKFLKKFLRISKKNSQKHKMFYQQMQLTFIYFFAIVVLTYSIRNFLGFIPDIILQFFPFLEQILDFNLLKILASPEKTFLIYLIILELLINRSALGFSLLVKFNVFLIFILEMIQNLLANYWDLIFGREIDAAITGSSSILSQNMNIAFYSFLYLFFLFIYLYCYYKSIKGLFPTFPSFLQCIIDSVAFWLQIKTSTMRFDGKNDKRK